MKIVHELKMENFTLILENNKSNGSMDLYAIVVGDEIYKLNEYYRYSICDKYNNINLNNYIYDVLHTRLASELNTYIENNINNYDFYDYDFFDNDCKIKNDFDSHLKNLGFELSFNNISKGIVQINIDYKTKCFYDLVKQELSEFNLLQCVYSESDLNIMVAHKQYELNKAHPAFNEIIECNKFLSGKKSVKLVIGEIEHKYQSGYSINFASLFRLNNGEYYINDSFNLNPRIKAPLPISTLQCLKYGNKIHKINIDNVYKNDIINTKE
jgi:hypothetical protein